MGLLSASVSISRYRVEGDVQAPILETVSEALSADAITEIDDDYSEKTSGWTSFQSPFRPDFSNHSFSVGTHLVFSLRIDKKTIPANVFKKHVAQETARLLAESKRPYLSKSEKNMVRERVTQTLSVRIPATPNLYDIIWNVEGRSLWFFSTLKSANEELETLFSRSFRLTLIRLFPFTMADLASGLSDSQRDALVGLTPTTFSG